MLRQVLEMAKDRAWLVKFAVALNQHWENKNSAKEAKGGFYKWSCRDNRIDVRRSGFGTVAF
jgi:hypothetical protein